MNYRIIFKNIGIVLLIISISMLPSFVISLIYSEKEYKAFLISSLIVFLIGFFLSLIKPKNTHIRIREGYAIVALGWIVASMAGTLPFLFSGLNTSFVDALFESISCFTTTGATVFSNIEILPKGIIFWKSFSLWLGGLGVIILIIALLPSVNSNSLFVMNAERSGPSPEKIAPKLRQTAKILFYIYCFLTLSIFLFLMAGGMPIFDSLVHAFGTIGTGGFSNKNLGIRFYNNSYFEIIILIFMFLSGINTILYYNLTKKNLKTFLKNEEFRFYVSTILIATVLISINLFINTYENLGEAIKYSSFHVVSMITTTGYTISNYNQWPLFSQCILLILMFIGACAGSTSGGIKCIRILLLFKIIKREIYKRIFSNSVYTIKINKKIVNEEIITRVSAFFVIYIIITVLATIIILLDGKDFVSSISAAVSSINNVDACFGKAGFVGNYSNFSSLSKITLSICMLLGRLEIYPLIFLCIPSFWKKTNF